MSNDTISTENAAIIASMEAVFTDRIKAPTVSGKWIIFKATVSSQTLSKFVKRAKDAGISGVWERDGKVGCLAA